MPTIVAIYRQPSAAQKVIHDLHMAGFGHNDIQQSTPARAPRSEDRGGPIGGSDAEGRSIGGAVARNMALGGVIGVFIGVTLGFLFPLDPVTVGFTAGALGAVIGAILTGLFKWGASSTSQQMGFVQVEVSTPDDRQEQVTEIMSKYDPVSMNERENRQPPDQDNAAESRSGLSRELLGAQEKRPSEARSGDILAVREGIYYDPDDLSQLDSDDMRLPDFEFYCRDFRQHFQQYYANGHSFEDYEPAYRYGYSLAVDHRHDDYTWYDIEPGVRNRWKEQYGDTWERYQDAIRYAWDRIRTAFNDSRRN
jgi:hypothetical protein